MSPTTAPDSLLPGHGRTPTRFLSPGLWVGDAWHRRTTSGRITANVAIQGGGRIVLLVLGVTTSTLLGRNLGPDGYGHFAYALAFGGALVPLVWFGLDQAVVRDIGARPTMAPHLLGSTFAVKMCLAGAATLGGLAVLPFLATSRDQALAMAFALIVLLNTALGTPGLIFTATLAGGWRTLTELLTAALFLGAVALLTSGTPPIWQVVLASGLAGTVGAAVLAALALRRTHVELSWSPSAWRVLLRRGAPFGFAGFLHQLYYRADVFLLGLLLDPHAVGLYVVAYALYDQTIPFFSYFSMSLLPVISSDPHSPSARSVIKQGLLLAIGAAACAALAFFLAGPSMLGLLYGADYAEAGRVLGVLGVVLAPSFGGSVLSYALLAIGREGSIWRLTGAALVVNVAANLILIPRLGWIGSAWAMLTSETVLTGLLFLTLLLGWRHHPGNREVVACQGGLVE